MPLFGNKRSRSLLPPDSERHLAIYGEHDYGTGPVPGVETTNWIVAVIELERQGLGEQAVSELHRIALGARGWALYGASSAINAFFPSQADTPIARELRDERLKFLHDERPPNLRSHLETGEVARYQKLYPEEFPDR